jgi:hypothetical protein
VLILLFASAFALSHSNAASAADFSSTIDDINSAFSATLRAQQSGGNVSALVESLNSALAFVQQAQSNNLTNPSLASQELRNATQIAQQVSTEAPAIEQEGASAKQTLMEESILGIIIIGILGAIVYAFGERIYRILWLAIYRDHVVKPNG